MSRINTHFGRAVLYIVHGHFPIAGVRVGLWGRVRGRMRMFDLKEMLPLQWQRFLNVRT